MMAARHTIQISGGAQKRDQQEWSAFSRRSRQRRVILCTTKAQPRSRIGYATQPASRRKLAAPKFHKDHSRQGGI